MASKKVLMVLSNRAANADANEAGGWYLPEALHPYEKFKEAGLEVEFASPAGGVTTCDPKSGNIDEHPELKELTQNTTALADVDGTTLDAVFYVGGFGVMWDFTEDANIDRVTRQTYEAGGIVGAVCHGPVALVNVKLSDGSYLVAGKEVTAFSNEEEEHVKPLMGEAHNLPKRDNGLTTCEDLLNLRGAKFSSVPKFGANVRQSGRVFTGQNPASAGPVGEAIANALGPKHPLTGCTLTYFPLPGRAETSRIMLKLAGVSFTDETLPPPQWPARKPNTPWLSLPYLTLADGTQIGQSLALTRFVAKHTNFYPSDPLAAAFVDQLVDAMGDVSGAIMKAGRGLDKPELVAARVEACKSTGPIGIILGRIDAIIAEHGNDGHAVGSELTLADFLLFVGSGTFISGFYDGIPKTVFDGFENIQAVRRTVANLPKIKAYLAERGGAWAALGQVGEGVGGGAEAEPVE